MLKKWSLINFLCLFLLIITLHLRQANAKYRTIVVDKFCKGNFTTIQSAIDSIPSNNAKWMVIYVRAGIYREKVKIPTDKPYIILKGEAKRTTKIVWGDYDTLAQSPTFTVDADNFVARSITFVNSYNYPPNSNRITPAVAARVSGDKCSFYKCGFSGWQDTLWDDQGRHYFKRCTIQGSVDFIFGAGRSIYEGCSIDVLGGGFITAQGREKEEDENGFVFKECNVFGNGPTKLGRPWREFARVIFYNSNLSSVVDPLGWDAWNCLGKEYRVTFAEYGNYGAGADASKRVRWEKKLSPNAIDMFTSLSYINSDNWIANQPF